MNVTERRKIWIATLRSGRYKECSDNTKKDDRYDAIGVLCELVIEQPSFATLDPRGGRHTFKWEGDHGQQSLPPVWLYTALGLQMLLSDHAPDRVAAAFEALEVEPGDAEDLEDLELTSVIIHLTDETRLSHLQIADFLEALWGLTATA